MKLNKRFYRKEAIEHAIEDFKEIAGIKLLNDDFEIEFTPIAKAEEDLEGEFKNYVIAVMKNNNMV